MPCTNSTRMWTETRLKGYLNIASIDHPIILWYDSVMGLPATFVLNQPPENTIYGDRSFYSASFLPFGFFPTTGLCVQPISRYSHTDPSLSFPKVAAHDNFAALVTSLNGLGGINAIARTDKNGFIHFADLVWTNAIGFNNRTRSIKFGAVSQIWTEVTENLQPSIYLPGYYITIEIGKVMEQSGNFQVFVNGPHNNLAKYLAENYYGILRNGKLVNYVLPQKSLLSRIIDIKSKKQEILRPLKEKEASA